MRTGRITPNEFVAITSTNIAKILNIYPRKGSVMTGADADLIIWDPSAEKTIKAENQKSIIDYNVFEGFKVSGLPRITMSRGDIVWDLGGNSVAQPRRGKHIERPAFPAANKALSTWKELIAPRPVRRDEKMMPIGV